MRRILKNLSFSRCTNKRWIMHTVAPPSVCVCGIVIVDHFRIQMRSFSIAAIYHLEMSIQVNNISHAISRWYSTYLVGRSIEKEKKKKNTPRKQFAYRMCEVACVCTSLLASCTDDSDVDPFGKRCKSFR